MSIAIIAVIIMGILVPVVMIFLCCVALMCLEIAKLVAIPIFFRYANRYHRYDANLSKQLFNFVYYHAKNQSDYWLRLVVANYSLVLTNLRRKQTIASLPLLSNADTQLSPSTQVDTEQNFIDPILSLPDHQNWIKRLLIPHAFEHHQTKQKLSKSRSELLAKLPKDTNPTNEQMVELFAGLPDPDKLPPPKLDDPQDWHHLLDLRPQDLWELIKEEWEEMIAFYFKCEVYQQIKTELSGNFANAGGCSRCAFVAACTSLFLLLYFIGPLFACVFLFSLFYPITALIVTWYYSGWNSVHYLQLTLTCFYSFALLCMLVMTPRVLSFQHASFHLFAIRRREYSRNAGVDEMKQRYISLFATTTRNKLVRAFFKDFATEIIEFLPRMHSIDNVNNENIDAILQTCQKFDDTFDKNIFDYA
ncbi:hypothetical protein RFI_04462 [Reticulomyxa filosa]|uniref:Uncharacterized protein n=1 Tax=Reticulomyxa filosa TaxID=46433 RepID=X6P3F0_RETFI|nr:hypothetical protein RFI_04462 [Reticulomyxa filosa]|eukprot:ETO32653.1 hypothetical protein RFI_04462 [Reticulomyxa filosa]